MAATFWPAVSPVVTEEAGTRGGNHNGIDLAAEVGDPVLAPFAGQIVYAGGDGAQGQIWVGGAIGWLKPNGEGLTLDLRRDDGSSYSGLISRVGHLSGFAVKSGDWVAPGQVIGYAGTTGYSTGPHIHWELRWDRAWSGGNWINPRDLRPVTFIPKEEDDMFSDADRKSLIEARDNARKTVTNQGQILKNQKQIIEKIDDLTKNTQRIYDATFIETETSRGTPGGTLVTGREILSELAEIRGLVESGAQA